MATNREYFRAVLSASGRDDKRPKLVTQPTRSSFVVDIDSGLRHPLEINFSIHGGTFLAAIRSDEFLGIRWRWRYYGNQGDVDEIHSFCPVCDYEVFPTNIPGCVLFRCESCGRDLRSFDMTHADLISRVIRLIQQKLRSGSWGEAANNRPINGRI